MKIAILGASGAIGSQLTQHLLDTTEHNLVLFSHHAKQIIFSPQEEQRLTHIDGDILQKDDIAKAVNGCDQVVYLIHLMGNRLVGRDFASAEQRAAYNLIEALLHEQASKVIYVGGAGNEEDTPTTHLQSRHKTGEILRSKLPVVIEYRTPMVIGADAAGYEVIRGFVNRLPIIPVPKWGNASTQPITTRDVVRYIDAAISADITEHSIVDIGGPEVLTYSEIFKRYAQYKNRKTRIFIAPFIPKKLVQFVFRLFKNSPSIITAADMIESSQHSYRVRTQVPAYAQYITTEPIENGFY